MFHINIIILLLWEFFTSVFFTDVCVTASLLKCLGLFSVFWPILIMLSFGWSSLISSIPLPLPNLCELFQVHHLQLVSPSLSCSTVFQFSSKVQILVSLFSFFSFYSVVNRDGKVYYSTGSPFLLFLLTITRSGCLAEIKWSVCILKFQRTLSVSSFRTDSGLCLYHLFVWSN